VSIFDLEFKHLGDATFDSFTLTNTGNMTVFVANYTPTGTVTWVKAVAHCDEDMGGSGTVDGSGIIYMANAFSGTVQIGNTLLSNADGWYLAITRLGGTPAALSFTEARLLTGTSVRLTIEGAVGSNVRLECATSLANSNQWMPLTNFFLPSSPYLFIDSHPLSSGNRFYQAVSWNH